MSNDSIFKKACLIQLATSCWIGSRSLNQGIMDNFGNGEWLRGQKYLVNPELLGPIKTTIQMARKFLNKSALPFPMTGLYLVPKDSIVDIDGHLDIMKNEFWSKVEAFVGFYRDARDEARQGLGNLFNETDYPENIREKFRFEWRFLLLDIPSRASILSPEIYLREKEKFQNLMAETRELATIALREEFGEIISHMVEKLNGNGDGRPKVFRSNMVNRINEFLDGFQDRNLFQDEKLAGLVEQTKAMVGGLNNPYAFQCNEVLRKKITSDFDRLKISIDEAIEELPRRRIRINNDPEPHLAAA